MIVVSDTTPVISLLKLGRLDLLQTLYNEVVIPEAVYHELVDNPAFPEESAAVRCCPFLRRESVRNAFAVRVLETEMALDRGESEALVLCDDLQADLLLVDERKARSVAKQLGMQIVGTLGLLVEAKRLGLVPKLRPLLETLREHNIRISNALMEELLRDEE
jgi:predicted nucleic acid-binding protein